LDLCLPIPLLAPFLFETIQNHFDFGRGMWCGLHGGAEIYSNEGNGGDEEVGSR
jgi:hypothetical protein